MKKIITITGLLLFITACKKEFNDYTYSHKIELSNKPLGLATENDVIYISDSDENSIVQINDDGSIIEKLENFDRPMHLQVSENKIYVPEYGKDSISIINNGEISYLDIDTKLSLDAPAGIDVLGDKIVIADFYNHRILAFNGKHWMDIGSEGHEVGKLNYPTDVQIFDDKIYVADAYNNRIQIFDWNGKSLNVFGENENMNAATGIYVQDSKIFITDFENDRVLIYDMDGNLKQIITEQIEKPTDLVLYKNQLWIANYGNNSITILKAG